MELVEFLLARIAEDEEECRREIADGYGGDQHESGWSSNRVLAECEAKRRIVEALAARGPDAGLTSAEDRGATWALRESCRLLALPYSDHPDYDEAWRL